VRWAQIKVNEIEMIFAFDDSRYNIALPVDERFNVLIPQSTRDWRETRTAASFNRRFASVLAETFPPRLGKPRAATISP
jgi:hypothetical protein